MSKQSPRQALKEAYNNLLPENKSLVNRKSLSGEFTPQALIEQLAELKSYGKKAASYQTSWYDQRTGYLEVNRRKVNAIWFVCGIIMAVIVYFRVNDSDLIWLGQGLLALSIVLPLIWGVTPLLANLQVSGKLIDADGLNLLLPLLLVLTDEIRPGSRIKLELYLGAANRGKHKVKTQKNYKMLTHRVIIRSWIGLVLLIGVYSILSMVNPQIFPPVIPFFVLPIIIVFYAFIYLMIFSIASSAFGKSPKVKARFLKIPRILIQAQLADGTLFQIDLTHWIIQKTAFKKKTKFKNFQLHKKKKKYKAKAVTSLKLAFPQKRYKMHPERFKGKFNRKLYISGKQVAKMKLKPGEKRQTIVYQHVQAKQGIGHNPATLPYPTFKQFTQLMIEGGYDRLRKNHRPCKRDQPLGGVETKQKLNKQNHNTYEMI